MSVITQRELRNDNAEIMRAVERGEAFTVTRRGVPVARVVPISEDPDVRCRYPATRPPDFSSLARVKLDVPSAAILDELRGDR